MTSGRSFLTLAIEKKLFKAALLALCCSCPNADFRVNFGSAKKVLGLQPSIKNVVANCKDKVSKRMYLWNCTYQLSRYGFWGTKLFRVPLPFIALLTAGAGGVQMIVVIRI